VVNGENGQVVGSVLGKRALLLLNKKLIGKQPY